MLIKPTREQVSAMARLSLNRDMMTVLGWLEESRDALREIIEADDVDHPCERGAARVLTLLLNEVRGAADELDRTLG